MAVAIISGELKTVPLNILERNISEDNPNEPLHCRLVGFDEGMTEVYFSLAMFIAHSDQAGVDRIKNDPPTEGCALSDPTTGGTIVMVPCAYLSRVFPEFADDLVDLRNNGIRAIMQMMQADGEA